MKKIIYIFTFILFLSGFGTHATTVVVNVEDFEFNPQTFTINLGDTIIWSLDNSAGAHTTTSTTIPAGATAWNQALTQSMNTYMYVPAVAGNYSYICQYHVTMGMAGTFTVSSSTGIASYASSKLSLMNVVVEGDKINVMLSLPKPADLEISLFNVIGQELDRMTMYKGEGIFTESLDAATLNRGIYFLKVSAGTDKIYRRFLVSR